MGNGDFAYRIDTPQPITKSFCSSALDKMGCVPDIFATQTPMRF